MSFTVKTQDIIVSIDLFFPEYFLVLTCYHVHIHSHWRDQQQIFPQIAMAWWVINETAINFSTMYNDILFCSWWELVGVSWKQLVGDFHRLISCSPTILLSPTIFQACDWSNLVSDILGSNILFIACSEEPLRSVLEEKFYKLGETSFQPFVLGDI